MSRTRQMRHPLAAAVIIVASMLPFEAVAEPAQRASQLGTLFCRMGPRVGLVVGSRQRLNCRYTQIGSERIENYVGRVTRFGLDLGVTLGGVMRWRVLASTRGQQNGALSGQYVGASADASLGFGIGGKFLIGGTRRSIMLQPLSVVGKAGVNIAAGVTGLNLRFTGTRIAVSIPLVPAKAGTQSDMFGPAYLALDSRLRGNERIML